MKNIVIGRVGRPHGVQGDLKVESFSGEINHFKKLKTVSLVKDGRRQEVEIEGLRRQAPKLIIKFKGIDTPEKARLLTGSEMETSRNHATPLKKGEYYYADLTQCQLIYKGKSVGNVKAIVEGGNGELLEISQKDGSTILVPFLNKFLGKVDLKKNQIELKVGEILE